MTKVVASRSWWPCPTPFPLRACRQPLPSRNPDPSALSRRVPEETARLEVRAWGIVGPVGGEMQLAPFPSPPRGLDEAPWEASPRSPSGPPAASRPWPRCRPPPTCCLVVSVGTRPWQAELPGPGLPRLSAFWRRGSRLKPVSV